MNDNKNTKRELIRQYTVIVKLWVDLVVSVFIIQYTEYCSKGEGAITMGYQKSVRSIQNSILNDPYKWKIVSM